ncbi:hypothetical protein ACMWQB_28780, partial [Escherichia coli]|uniref:hypothetical protein n=1 Tax=Escherichia coli TaxID=562 RepID=UPI0039E190E0
IGSGITADATADAEWAEWGHKRAFLGAAAVAEAPGFELLETLALVDGTLRDAPLHVERMAGAAAHFGFDWNAARVEAALQSLRDAHAEGTWRV